MRALVVFLLSLLCAITLGGTITVTSPTANAYLGLNNTLSFTITGAHVEVTVTAVVTAGNGGGSTTISDKFTPDADGKINNSLPLNFSQSSPEGPYTITVTATEPNATYNDLPPIPVTVIVNAPKILDYSPNDSGFVRGIVPISIKFSTAALRDWRIQINNQDIPNNTGTTGTTALVNWDTSGIQNDGAQTINIRIRDLAGNVTNKSIAVTLDRIQPVATIQYPKANSPVVNHQAFNVLIDIQDASSVSVDVTGIDVIVTDINDKFLFRVPRESTSSSSNVLRWIGRVRSQVYLPNPFKLVVNAVDRAGNVATQQVITVGTQANQAKSQKKGK
ncbi:MAG: hypothetical protein JSS72_10305 [Armatimonadetes bacterium]|nr:hypothetical protein [Armatimonadota bacterium]